MSTIQIVHDANRKQIRVGDVVQQTFVIDHAGKLYTFVLQGKVVEIVNAAIVVMIRSPHEYSINPWAARDWTIIGHEALS